MSKIGRRSFLIKSISAVPMASLAGCGISKKPDVNPGHGTAASDNDYTPKFFNAEEWAFINAACARLIPNDETGPGAVETGVPEFIDRQMEGAFGHAARWYMQGPFLPSTPDFGYQGKATPREVYRAGIHAVDKYCLDHYAGKRFTECDPTAQDEILTALEDGHISSDDVSGKDFFTWLLQNTKEGYLADPIHGGNKDMGAWKMIGFPGARADFADWVGRHGEHYPIGPVGVGGRPVKVEI